MHLYVHTMYVNKFFVLTRPMIFPNSSIVLQFPCVYRIFLILPYLPTGTRETFYMLSYINCHGMGFKVMISQIVASVCPVVN